METVRALGYKTEKRIESDAFWAADQQRIDEATAMKDCKEKVVKLQQRLAKIWDKRAVRRNLLQPGPNDY